MNFGIEFWAFTLDLVGKLLVAATALLAHRLVVKHKGIDDIVLKDLKIEISTGILGILLMVAGYVLHILK